jgi:hypothetical protein
MYHSRSSSQGHSSYRKRGTFFPFLIIRLILSLILFSIFGFGIYRAIVYFSGVDPINIDPQKFLVEVMASDSSAKTLSKLFNLDPKALLKGKISTKSNSDQTDQPSSDDSQAQPSGEKILTFAVSI